MKAEIQNAIEHAIIEYLLSEEKKPNNYIDFKLQAIQKIASKAAIPIAEKYAEMWELNDTEAYLAKIDELIGTKNYTVEKAWIELEDNLSKYVQNPKYLNLQAVFNARSKRYRTKFHNKNLKK